MPPYVEVPVAYVTWRNGAGVRQQRVIYPHCLDLSWWERLNNSNGGYMQIIVKDHEGVTVYEGEGATVECTESESAEPKPERPARPDNSLPPTPPTPTPHKR